jgi:prepilin-type N-terminal cleavage/methylation domain-containing protein
VTAHRPGKKGFTLLEVIVAMALFAAGIVMISRLFTGSLRLSGGARDASAASIYARQRMEEALLVPNPVEGAEQGAFGDNYRWEVATFFVPQEEEEPYDEIRLRVTVRWEDGVDGRAVNLSATRWRWKETGEGDLALGSGRRPAGSGSGGDSLSGPGSGGEESDYLGAFVRRRLR